MKNITFEDLVDHVKLGPLILSKTKEIENIDDFNSLFIRYLTHCIHGYQFFEPEKMINDIATIKEQYCNIQYIFDYVEKTDSEIAPVISQPIILSSLSLLPATQLVMSYRGIVEHMKSTEALSIEQYHDYLKELSDHEQNRKEFEKIIKTIQSKDFRENSIDWKNYKTIVSLHPLITLPCKITIFREVSFWILSQYREDYREMIINERIEFFKRNYGHFTDRNQRNEIKYFATPLTFYNWGCYMEAEYMAIRMIYNAGKNNNDLKTSMLAIAIYFALMKINDYLNTDKNLSDERPPARLRESLASKYMCEMDFGITTEKFFTFGGGSTWFPLQACINDALDN